MILVLCIFTGCSKQEAGDPGGQDYRDEAAIDVLSSDPGDLEVHFLDVGQADCILIRSAGHFMLIDAGNGEDEEYILSYLKEQGADRLDYVIATHPHEDHIGSMAAVIRNFEVDRMIMPQRVHTTKTFENMVMAIEEKQLHITPAKAGDTYRLGDAEFTVLSPVNEKETDSLNNVSVGIRLVYGNNSFVMCGDAEAEEEADICRNSAELKADVLKVGHHGSHTSTSAEFLKAVAPEIAVISVGTGNDYGHPDKDAMKRLKDIGADIYRTDELGTIVLTSDGNDVGIRQGDEETDLEMDFSQNEIGLTEYVLNTSTKKFHRMDCSSVNEMKEKNKELYQGSRDELIEKGYMPCKTCNP